MLGDFIFHNPTELYFGEDVLDYLDQELPNYGKNVQLIYGKGSIKKNGLVKVERVNRAPRYSLCNPHAIDNILNICHNMKKDEE